MFYVRFLELFYTTLDSVERAVFVKKTALFLCPCLMPSAVSGMVNRRPQPDTILGGDVFYPPDTYALCATVSGATTKSVSCGHPLPAWLFVAENRCPQPDTRCLRCRPGWCWMPAARGAVRGGFCRIPAVTAVLNGRPEDADLLVARDTVTHVKVSRAIAFPAAWCPVEDTDLPSRRVRHLPDTCRLCFVQR